VLSDIDLLLVRPPQLTERQSARWVRQVDDLRQLVREWTGNHLQVVEMPTSQWADHGAQRSPLFQEIECDAIPMTQSSIEAKP
jgi:hypothetical protein